MLDGDFEEKYRQLRKEYLAELENNQFFYRSYQKLLLRYRDLKDQHAGTLETRLKVRIRLIRKSASLSAVKTMYDNLLREIDEMLISYKAHALVSTYKAHFDKSNKRAAKSEKQLGLR